MNDFVVVCSEFNKFLANVAFNIGRNDDISLDENISSIADSYSGYPSTEAINSHISSLIFQVVSEKDFRTLLNGLNLKSWIRQWHQYIKYIEHGTI